MNSIYFTFANPNIFFKPHSCDLNGLDIQSNPKRGYRIETVESHGVRFAEEESEEDAPRSKVNMRKLNLSKSPKAGKERNNILNMDVSKLDPRTIRLTYLYQIAAEERTIKKQYFVVGTTQSNNVVALETEQLINPNFHKKRFMKREKLLKSEAIELISHRQQLQSEHTEAGELERINSRKQSPINNHENKALRSYRPFIPTSRKASEPAQSRLNLNLTNEENEDSGTHSGQKDKNLSFSVRNSDVLNPLRGKRFSSNPRQRPGAEYTDSFFGNPTTPIRMYSDQKGEYLAKLNRKNLNRSAIDQITPVARQLETELSNQNSEIINPLKLPKIPWKNSQNIESFPASTKSKDFALLLDETSRRREELRIAKMSKPLAITKKKETTPIANQILELTDRKIDDNSQTDLIDQSTKNGKLAPVVKFC